MDRRGLLAALPLPVLAHALDAPRVETVQGSVPASDLGLTLVHEHALVDFVGAERVRRDRYNAEDVFRIALPFLEEAKKAGVSAQAAISPCLAVDLKGPGLTV